MKAGNSPLRVLLLVVLALFLIFVFLSFASPMIPISRVDYEGIQRLEIVKVERYIEAKSNMGLISTSNKKLSDAQDILGPLVEKVTIKPRFFFRATVNIYEKQDTFALAWGRLSGRIAVDIEGNFIEDITPDNTKKVEFEILSKNAGNISGFNEPSPSMYPFDLSKEDENASENLYLRPLIGMILQYRSALNLNFFRVLRNEATYFIYQNIRGEYILVAPYAVNNLNPVFVEFGGEIHQLESIDDADDLKSANPDEKPKQIFYNKVNLETARGLFGETNQGMLIYFGTSTGLETKFGALGHLMDTEFSKGETLPLMIKLDIPHQVTTVPRKSTVGS